MNTERVLLELNFLVRTTHELQLKLQGDGVPAEHLEVIVMDVLLSGCRTAHTMRVDENPVYDPDELPHLETLFMSVCQTYDDICGRVIDEAADCEDLNQRDEIRQVIFREEIAQLSNTVTSIYRRL